MKKTLYIIISLFCLLMVSSCKYKTKINEIRVNGEILSEESIQQYVDEYERVNKQIEEGNIAKSYYSGWYDLSINWVSNFESREKTDVISTTTYKLKGSIYDSSIAYEMKAKLSFESKEVSKYYDDNQTYCESTIESKNEVILLKGIVWQKSEVKTKQNEKTSVIKNYSKLSLQDMLSELPIDIEGGSLVEGLRALFIEEIFQVEEEKGTSLEVEAKKYKTNKGFFVDINCSDNNKENEYQKLLLKYDCDKDTYITKHIQAYFHKISNQTTKFSEEGTSDFVCELKLKKKLMGIVMKPIHAKEYN